MNLIADVFRTLRTQKNVLDQCLISRALEETSKSNILNGLKHG